MASGPLEPLRPLGDVALVSVTTAERSIAIRIVVFRSITGIMACRPESAGMRRACVESAAAVGFDRGFERGQPGFEVRERSTELRQASCEHLRLAPLCDIAG